MLAKTRLGKRSPLGELVTPGQETGDISITLATATAGQPSSCRRSVSSNINVPRSQIRPQEVDMDELMAAMVLTSLSCSPLPCGPTHSQTAALTMDCGGGELSNSSSDYWSIGHSTESPSPSPPIKELCVSPATPHDEGLEMELEQVLFDEPAARKRRVSGHGAQSATNELVPLLSGDAACPKQNPVKVAYRCLWPSCGKVLTSVVGIKRHIRMTHLWHGGEHERCSRSEEDFYYTEINQWEQPQSPSLPVFCGLISTSPGDSSSPSSPPSPPPPFPPFSPPYDALSRSAPSTCFWQVQSEHSYQAPPPGHVNTAACVEQRSTNCLKQGSIFRTRSVSVGEQWLQQQSAPCRRIRGEAKKCRKVYGIEHRERWCTACRWKKACQRFVD